MLFFCFLTQVYALPRVYETGFERQGLYFVDILYRLDSWSTTDNTMTMCGYARPQCFVLVEQVGGSRPVGGWVINTEGSDSSVGLTLGQLLAMSNIVIPYNGQWRMSSSISSGCLSVTLNLDGFGVNNPNRQVISASCVVGQVPVRCDIGGSTMINHGTLSDTALNGSQASTQLNVKCNASTTVTVSATQTNSWGVRLRSDDSLYSVVTINNWDATNGINVLTTSNVDSPLNITSTLVTRGAVAPGPFSGSTVITVTPN